MRLFRASLLVAALLSCNSLVFTQTGGQRETKTVVIRAARMFDGRGERVVSPGVVVVAGGRIQAAGADAAIAAGAEVIDLGDATLLPGFMDARTHLAGESSDDWKQDELDNCKKSVAEQALDATVYARRTLM